VCAIYNITRRRRRRRRIDMCFSLYRLIAMPVSAFVLLLLQIFFLISLFILFVKNLNFPLLKFLSFFFIFKKQKKEEKMMMMELDNRVICVWLLV
jgi:hypothetical protein